MEVCVVLLLSLSVDVNSCLFRGRELMWSAMFLRIRLKTMAETEEQRNR